MEPYEVVRWCRVDNIKDICNDMHKRGYDVISVVYDVECSRYVIVGKLRKVDTGGLLGP